MVKKNTTLAGHLGEDVAVQFLVSLGYKVLHRNLRTKFGEADIVAVLGNKMILVEVKQRSTHTYGSPEDSITAFKHMKLIRLAHWLESQYPEYDVSIDMIAVDGNKVSLHLQNIEIA